MFAFSDLDVVSFSHIDPFEASTLMFLYFCLDVVSFSPIHPCMWSLNSCIFRSCFLSSETSKPALAYFYLVKGCLIFLVNFLYFSSGVLYLQYWPIIQLFEDDLSFYIVSVTQCELARQLKNMYSANALFLISSADPEWLSADRYSFLKLKLSERKDLFKCQVNPAALAGFCFWIFNARNTSTQPPQIKLD